MVLYLNGKKENKKKRRERKIILYLYLDRVHSDIELVRICCLPKVKGTKMAEQNIGILITSFFPLLVYDVLQSAMLFQIIFISTPIIQIIIYSFFFFFNKPILFRK